MTSYDAGSTPPTRVPYVLSTTVLQGLYTCTKCGRTTLAVRLDYTASANVLDKNCLQSTRVDNGGLDSRADRAGAAANSLNLLDDLVGLLVGNLTENDVLAVQPRGHNGGDEELRAVAASR